MNYVIPVVNFVKNKVATVKGVSIIICIASIYFSYNLLTARVVPMSYGADAVGANSIDLFGLGLSSVTAIVSFLVSRFTGVSVNPEVIQAVINFEKNSNDSDAQRRVAAALLGYLVAVIEKHPSGSGSFVLQLLTTLVGAIRNTEVRNILSEAATKVATNEFKQVEEPTSPANV